MTTTEGKRLQPLEFSSSALSAVKWLALILMVIDHGNKYLLDGSQHWMYAAGRVSMPLFAFTLAYNLARPGMLESGAYRRTSVRLAFFGALSTLPFIALNQLLGGWWPLNMLFTFLVAVTCAWLIDQRKPTSTIAAWLVFVWGGAMGEYWWPAIGFCLSVWAYQKRPSLALVLLSALCLVLLFFVNGNFWALAAVPCLLALRKWPVQLPRLRYGFYAFYPAHLFAMMAYRWYVGKPLYGFFA
jgi:hypothetical protein